MRVGGFTLKLYLHSIPSSILNEHELWYSEIACHPLLELWLSLMLIFNLVSCVLFCFRSVDEREKAGAEFWSNCGY